MPDLQHLEDPLASFWAEMILFLNFIIPERHNMPRPAVAFSSIRAGHYDSFDFRTAPESQRTNER